MTSTINIAEREIALRAARKDYDFNGLLSTLIDLQRGFG